MEVQTEQESNRLRHAQEKARQEEKYNTMQKQIEEFQKMLKTRPKLFFHQVLQKLLSLENREDLDQEEQILAAKPWKEKQKT